jgi:hypothetical protein
MPVRGGAGVLSLLLLGSSGVACASAQQQDTTGRELLFSSPTAALPDVLISESHKAVVEGGVFSYTVVLTHAPGMREDNTIDLRNDEVRIYLTSSQEVYQQDDESATLVKFQQRVGHRTQLQINTNVKTASNPASPTAWSTAAELLAHTKGPTPYTYVAYSTVNPTQASPRLEGLTGAHYKVVCPLCTHEAFCKMKPGTVIAGTKSNGFTAKVVGTTVEITSAGKGATSTVEIDAASGNKAKLMMPAGSATTGSATPLTAGKYTTGNFVAKDFSGSGNDEYLILSVHDGVSSEKTVIHLSTNIDTIAKLVTLLNAANNKENFDGCQQITYRGFAPVIDQCSTNGAAIRKAGTGASVTPVYVGYKVLNADIASAALEGGAGDVKIESVTQGTSSTVAINANSGPNALLVVGAAAGTSTQGSGANSGKFVGRWVSTDFSGTKAEDLIVEIDGIVRIVRLNTNLNTAAKLVEVLAGAFVRDGQSVKAGAGGDPDGVENTPAPGIPRDDSSMVAHACYPVVSSFDGETTASMAGGALITRTDMGGVDPGWLHHYECWDKVKAMWVDCAGKLEAVPTSCGSTSCEPTAVTPTKGKSDFRIRADGSPVLRDIPRLDDYCRYCDRAGLMCDDDAAGFDPSYGTKHALAAEGTNKLYGKECIKDTVNGGDTAPNSQNWLLPNYAGGPSWRGDLSSGAQLVFDSTNWNVAQTVVVMARDDNVFEPEVNRRGQDAYVHHYVVAQDINLQHTYYEDIDVNDLVVSITDNDPAVVLQKDSVIEPKEGVMFADSAAKSVSLRLASEPMYDVTVYVQSGPFLDGSNPPLPMPDDEQVIFQDKGQASVCFDAVTGLRSVSANGAAHVNDCAAGDTLTTNSADATHPIVATAVGTNVKIESKTVGTSSSVVIDVSAYGASGENAKALFSSGSATAGLVASAGSFTGTFTAYDFSASNKAEDLVMLVDGLEYILTLDVNCNNAAALVSALNAANKLKKTNTKAGAAQAWDGRRNVFACDPTGVFVRPESYKDFNNNVEHIDSKLPTGWACTALTTEAACKGASPAAGCAWQTDHNVWSTTNCVGYDDSPSVIDSADPFPLGSAYNVKDHDGTKYPVPVSAATRALCEDRPLTGATARIWSDQTGCTGANGVIVAEATEATCTKTGNRWVGDDTAPGLCKTAQANEALDTQGNFYTSAATCEAQSASARGSCVDAMGGRVHANLGRGRPAKSMDIVCGAIGIDQSTCVAAEGCVWDTTLAKPSSSPGAQGWPQTTAGICRADNLGYDCNSYLVFTSTNWNTWQTLTVIAVNDDEDETVDRPGGVDTSKIGYLYTSRDWYYNSDGAEQLTVTKTVKPTAPWSLGTPDGGSDVVISMFDTRFGNHINRYPWPQNSDADPSKPTGIGVCSSLLQLASMQSGDVATGSDLYVSATGRRVHDENAMSTWVDYIASPGADVVVAAASGNLKITSPTAGLTSTVTIGSGTGNNAQALFGSGTATQGTAAPAAGYYTGASYSGYNFAAAGKAESLNVIIDGVSWTLTLDIDMSAMSVTQAATALQSAFTRERQRKTRVVTLGGHVDEPGGYLDEPHHGCTVGAPHAKIASNQVCLDTDAAATATVDGPVQQVKKFEPAEYTRQGATCGAENRVQDVNRRQVTISRGECSTTEGRRFYHKNFNHQKNPTDTEWTGFVEYGSTKVLASTVLLAAAQPGGANTKVRLTSKTTGTSSSVSLVQADSGANAFALFGATQTSTTGTAVPAAGYMNAAAAPVAYDFSTKGAEDLVLTIDGERYTMNFATNIANLGALVTAMNGATLTKASRHGVTQKAIPGHKLPVTLGLFTNTAGQLDATKTASPGDLWTSEYLLASEAQLYGGSVMPKMSMPTCPFTIKLETSPLEGATVVVKVGEDPELTALRDNELYFYEEPTFRPGVEDKWICENHFPGSRWLPKHDGGSCFIQNVPYVDVVATASGTGSIVLTSASTGTSSTVRVHASSGANAKLLLGSPGNVDGSAGVSGKLTATWASKDFSTTSEPLVLSVDGVLRTITLNANMNSRDVAVTKLNELLDSTYSTGEAFQPRGGTVIDVMFTDQDWDIPRRITSIALNDDVDEPDEKRNIYFDIGPCPSLRKEELAWNRAPAWGLLYSGAQSGKHAVDSTGKYMYFADTINHRIIQVVLSTGATSALAGLAGVSGDTDGTSTAARFNAPADITIDSSDANLYVADSGNNKIRKIVIATQAVTTFVGPAAGTTTSGDTNAIGTAARLNTPKGITTDGTNLFVSDTGNNKIRKVVIATAVTTVLAGPGPGTTTAGDTDGAAANARFSGPQGIERLGGSVYVADTGSNKIRKIVIATGATTTFAGPAAGTTTAGNTDGTGVAARFNGPQDLASDSTDLFVADTGNNKIRKIAIATGAVTTFAGDGTAAFLDHSTGTQAKFNGPSGIVHTSSTLYVMDSGNQKIRKIGIALGSVTTPVATIAGLCSGNTDNSNDVACPADTTPKPAGTKGTTTAACCGTAFKTESQYTTTNHNNGETCIEDPLYNDAKIVSIAKDLTERDYIEVTVVDDDIADLVVLCGDNAGGDATATTGDLDTAGAYVDSCSARSTKTACQTTNGCVWNGQVCTFDYEDDEYFIGSYDDSHPHNRWDEQIERRGADAEDGMSYSKFGGGISTFYDGITGDSGAADCPSCGYVSIIENHATTKMNRRRCRVRTTKYLSELVEAGLDEEGCYPDATVVSAAYDPYTDQYCTAGNGKAYGPHCEPQNFVDTTKHVRGFKGVGPAFTESTKDDQYVCTVHSRECKLVNGALVDAEGSPCVYGTFKVRLNSSPGTKTVRRKYVGSTEGEVLEEEPVLIVITPDKTPQTEFSPSSVTFTHVGGRVGGADTYRWDEPVTIEVRPVDDSVDERMGVIMDLTAFTVTQSHKFDEYWMYTTPYMITSDAKYSSNRDKPNIGNMCTWATTTASSGSSWTYDHATVPDSCAQYTTKGIVTTADALLLSAGASPNDLTEAITVQSTFVDVPATSITSSLAGTGLALKYTTNAGGTAIDRITVTSSGTGYVVGEIITVAKAALAGRVNDLKFALVANDLTTIGQPIANWRNEEVTPYRHTIRTIHTMDNDFSGVRIESPVSDARDLASAMTTVEKAITGVTTASDQIVMAAHGLLDGDMVVYVKPATPTLAIPELTDGTTYYVRDRTASNFKLAASVGGGVVGLTASKGTAGEEKFKTFAGVTEEFETKIPGCANGACVASKQYVQTAAAAAVTVTKTITGVTAGNAIVITTHGLLNGAQVVYIKPSTPTLEIPELVDGTTYYVRDKTANAFKLAAASGGTAIAITNSKGTVGEESFKITTGITITSTSTGLTSSVVIDASSGTNAKAAVGFATGSITAAGTSADQGSVGVTAGYFAGIAPVLQMSGAESLIISIDGVSRTLSMPASVGSAAAGSVDKVVAFLNARLGNPNYYTHLPSPLTVEEGSGFTFYTLQLDTQPRKVQRQTGTAPNSPIVFTPGTTCKDEGTGPFGGAVAGDFFGDWTDATRPHACGSVEPEQKYWVDVTASQTVHIDLATPLSCPAGADTPWGGGATKTWAASDLHPRYPFNAKNGKPFDELVDSPGDMNGYLTTCGGWQRDATYRFTADNWNVPQYVYVYAHNDKDSHDTKNAKLMPKGVSVSKSGSNLVLTTVSMGSSSAVVIDASSGANAKALFGSTTTGSGIKAVTGATASGAITMTGHGLENDDVVIYAKPATPSSNVAQLTDGTAYYVRDKTPNAFKLAATKGGVAIAVTGGTNGEEKFRVQATLTGGSFAAYDFSATKAENLVLQVDSGPKVTVVLHSNIRTVDGAVGAIANGIAKAMSFYVAYGGNEQTDASVGFDPQPHIDTDGRDGGVPLADYGKSFGETICSSLAAAACAQTAGCTWGSVSGSTVCYWSGSRPDYFARSTATRKSTYTSVIRHYVETQDTLDNMQGTGFIQWNKHGGIYTYGNAERFPFGINRYSGAPEYAKLDETGSSTWGYSKYESLYGYGYFKNGVWSTAGCCSTSMGGNWGTTTGGTAIWGTDSGLGGTDSNAKGAEFQQQTNGNCRFAVSQRDLNTFAQARDFGTAARANDMKADMEAGRWTGPGEYTRGTSQITVASGAVGASTVPPDGDGDGVGDGDCFEIITGNKLPRPHYRAQRSASGGKYATADWWKQPADGAFCTPVADNQFCIPRFATSYQSNTESEYTLGYRPSTDRSTGHAMKFPPLNVWVAIKDNDAQRDLTAAERAEINTKCRQTRLFQFADKLGSGSAQKKGLTKSRWLTDYNCLGSQDAGVLPGFPVSTESGDNGVGFDPNASDGWTSPLVNTPNLRVPAPVYTLLTTAVSDGSDQITIARHQFKGNDQVVYESKGGAAIGGLTDKATYYVLISGANIKLSAASGGAAIDLTSTGNNLQTLTAVQVPCTGSTCGGARIDGETTPTAGR